MDSAFWAVKKKKVLYSIEEFKANAFGKTWIFAFVILSLMIYHN